MQGISTKLSKPTVGVPVISARVVKFTTHCHVVPSWHADRNIPVLSEEVIALYTALGAFFFNAKKRVAS